MNDLPDWQKLLKLIGEDEAAALSALFGGGRLYVPKFLGAHHPITETVGAKAAAIVAAEFGGGHIEIPMALGKRAQVAQLIEAGRSVPEICRRVGVSRRHVFYVKDELNGGPGRSGRRDQPDLF
ncbi:helix-turn-helix domain-containing protein [Brevundimonas sp.]|uniref:helix-turn-helix domain-containing protein n=1 Tax=Brevundimonas sp. TaxID=1871086 RepID=UPI003D6CB98D